MKSERSKVDAGTIHRLHIEEEGKYMNMKSIVVKIAFSLRFSGGINRIEGI